MRVCVCGGGGAASCRCRPAYMAGGMGAWKVWVKAFIAAEWLGLRAGPVGVCPPDGASMLSDSRGPFPVLPAPLRCSPKTCFENLSLFGVASSLARTGEWRDRPRAGAKPALAGAPRTAPRNDRPPPETPPPPFPSFSAAARAPPLPPRDSAAKMEAEGRHIYDPAVWEALTEAERDRAELGLAVHWVENAHVVSREYSPPPHLPSPPLLW